MGKVLACITLMMLQIAGLRAQHTSFRVPHDYTKQEHFDIKFGGGEPFTWNASCEYVIPNDSNGTALNGFRIGILAQGPHDPTLASDKESRARITTYGFLGGWSYRFISILPRLEIGTYGYLGHGSTKDENIKLHYNIGYVFQCSYTILEDKAYLIAPFFQWKRMYRQIQKEKRGIDWESLSEALDYFNAGISIKL